MRAPASGDVTSAWSAEPPMAVGDLRQRGTGARHVDAHDGGAVAGEGAGDVGADAAGSAGDDGDLPVEGRPGIHGGGLGLADAEDLAVDVRRAGREQEQHRAEGCLLGPRGEEHEVGRGTGAKLLGHRAGDAFERALGGPLRGRSGGCRVRADDDDAGAAAQPLQGRTERGPQRLEVGGGARRGQVDDDTAEPALCGHLVDEGGTRGGQVAAKRSQRGGGAVATDEHGAVDEGAPGDVAPQRDRLGQAERGRDPLAEPGGHEGRVAVTVRHLRPPRGSRRRPVRRRRRSRSGLANPCPSRAAAWPGWRRCAHRSRRTGVPRPGTSRRR